MTSLVLLPLVLMATTGCPPVEPGGGDPIECDRSGAPTPIAQPLAHPHATGHLTPHPAGGAPSAIWANTGEDKVTRDELRASRAIATTSPVWDGERIRLMAARNETVAFNLVLEAADADARIDAIRFSELLGPQGVRIASASRTAGSGLFDWRDRPIELFVVRYLPIRGLSLVSYDTYDERHLPRRFRRPWSGDGEGRGGWQDRPDHDREYPDIAVPIEAVGAFGIPAGHNQSVWCDIYVPRDALPGEYTGTIELSTGGGDRQIPIELTVWNFALPDANTAKTMAYLGFEDIVTRYFGLEPDDVDVGLLQQIRDRHFQLAHRHRISLIDGNEGVTDWACDEPRPEWVARLSGELFTPDRGYDGPGVGASTGVFSIGTYGDWDWIDGNEADMRHRTDAWENWFGANFPNVERFLYLADEPDDSSAYSRIERWARWVRSNPGSGGNLRTFVTAAAPLAAARMPSVDIVASWSTLGRPTDWRAAVDRSALDARRRFYLYNSFRPFTGTFAIEDDGVALRQLAWTHYKHRIDRWFYWETTYYNNFQAGAGQTNVFQQAQTFGEDDTLDAQRGRTGWQYGNGDGVLFYPGTDRVFPDESYGLAGPIASLRLKHWRRGLQDVEYLTLAATIDPAAVAALVKRMVPTSLWEYGVTDADDPTYVLTPVEWSDEAADWEAARRTLGEIIRGAR